MGLPVAAATVTATPTAPTVATPTAPTTATPTTATATTTKPTAPAAAAGKFPGEDPQGAGYVGRREVARRQAARDAEAAKKPATPNFGQQAAGYKSVNYAPNIKTGVGLPKPAAAAAPTKPGFLQTATDKIAAKKTTAPQPEMAEGAMPAAVIRIKEKIRQMSDAEKKEYFQGKTREQLQQLARRHGYGENSNVYAKYAAQGLNEFAPGGGGDDDIGDDPYKYPKPTRYRRSADYFGQFEADHFDREDFDDATGVFKGYWGRTPIAYFKFANPARTGGDDPGMGWYYEPQSGGSDNPAAGPAVDRSDERKQQELSMINAFLKSGNRPNPDSQIGQLMKKHGIAEGWRDEADDFSEWSDYVREKLSKSSNEQRLGLAKKLSQLEVKHFGSAINGGFDRATGKPIAGLGLTDTVKQILKSFGSEAEYTRQANAALNPQDGPAGNFSMPFGSVDVAGLEDASPEVLRVMKKAVMLGADVAAEARNFYKKHGTLTDQDLPKIQMSLANNASSEWNKQHGMAEGMTQAVDAKGRTQAQWLALVKAKFPPGGPVTVTKMIQAKMIDGPIIAYLSNGKQIGWKKVEQVDEIFNPSSSLAAFLRGVASVAGDLIPAALTGVGTAVAASALVGPLAGGLMGTTAGNALFQAMQNQQNRVPGMLQKLIEKHFGSEAEQTEFSVLHAKNAYQGQSEFRWRGKQWPVTLRKNDAEAIIEKNDKYWLDAEKQKAIDAEKAKDDMDKEQGVSESAGDELESMLKSAGLGRNR
jgi:hypothetical protein